MKQLTTLCLLFLLAIGVQAQSNVVLRLTDKNGQAAAGAEFFDMQYNLYVTDENGCATLSLEPGKDHYQISFPGVNPPEAINYEWNGTDQQVNISITEAYWMTLRLTNLTETEQAALRHNEIYVSENATNMGSMAFYPDEEMCVRFWFRSPTLYYSVNSFQFFVQPTKVDIPSSGNYINVDLKAGRTPVDVACPIGVDNVRLTEGNCSLHYGENSAVLEFGTFAEAESIRAYMLPGTYTFELRPIGYMSYTQKVEITDEPARINFDMSASRQIRIHFIDHYGQPLTASGAYINLSSTNSNNPSSGGNYIEEGSHTFSILAMPGEYTAYVDFEIGQLSFPYNYGNVNGNIFTVADADIDVNLSFEHQKLFLITLNGLNAELDPSVTYEARRNSLISSHPLHRDYSATNIMRYGFLIESDQLDEDTTKATFNIRFGYGDDPYVNFSTTVPADENGDFIADITPNLQPVTLRTPEGYGFVRSLIIDGETYTAGLSDNPVSELTYYIQPGQHTWQANLTSADGATNYPQGAEQAFTVEASATNVVTYTYDASAYPGLRLQVTDIDGTAGADFGITILNYDLGINLDFSTNADGQGTIFVEQPGRYLVEVVDGNEHYLPQTFYVELGQGLATRNVSFEEWHALTVTCPDLSAYNNRLYNIEVRWNNPNDPEDMRNGSRVADQIDATTGSQFTLYVPAGQLQISYDAQSYSYETIVADAAVMTMPAADAAHTFTLSNIHRVSYFNAAGEKLYTDQIDDLWQIADNGERTRIEPSLLMPAGTYEASYNPYDYDNNGTDSYADTVRFSVTDADVQVRFNVSPNDYVDVSFLFTDMSDQIYPGTLAFMVNGQRFREGESPMLRKDHAYTVTLYEVGYMTDDHTMTDYRFVPEPLTFTVGRADTAVTIPMADYHPFLVNFTYQGNPVSPYSADFSTAGHAPTTLWQDGYGQFRLMLHPGVYTVELQASASVSENRLYGRFEITADNADAGEITVELSDTPVGISSVTDSHNPLTATASGRNLRIGGAPDAPISVSLYTTGGQRAMSATVSSGQTLSAAHLPAGIYIVRLTQGSAAQSVSVMLR